MTGWFDGADGLRLAADLFGPPDGAPVILIGGIGQTRHSWHRVARQLADKGWRAITLDIRGHGESDRSPTADYGYLHQMRDLTAVIERLGEAAIVVGASLGGKIALATAGYGPSCVRALVMVDTVPRTRADGVGNAIRTIADPPDGYASPQDAAEALARWRGMPVASGAGEKLRRNMWQASNGRWHWHWDQSYVQRDHGLGMVAGLDYLETAASRVDVPALVTRGELSDVVDDAGIAALRILMPQLESEVIAGARHMIVGDANDIFADALIRFLDRHPELRATMRM